MIGTLIGIIFACIILGLIWWAAQRLLALIPLGEPFATIVHVLVVILIAVIAMYIIAMLLGLIGVHVPMSLGGR